MANEEVKTLLDSWNLSAYVDNFTEHNVSVILMPLLEKEMLDVLIPKVGDQLLFKIKCKENFGECASSASILKDVSNTTRKRTSTSSEKIVSVKKSKNEVEKSTFINLDSLSVIDILSNSERGKNILYRYNKKKNLLSKDRNYIVDVVIAEVRKLTTSSSNELFESLATKIVSVFSASEVLSTYYIAPIKLKESGILKRSVACKGKIPNKWRNNAVSYKLLNDDESEAQDENEDNVDEDPLALDPDIQKSIEWLQSNAYSNLKGEIATHWKSSANYRLSQIKSDKNLKISTIFDTWEILKQSNSHDLILIDFENQQLTDVEADYESFNVFYQRISEISTLQKKDEAAKSLQNILKSKDLSKDIRFAVQLLLLSHHVPPKAVCKLKNKQTWKVGVLDSKNSIVLHAVIEGDIEAVKQNRIAFMEKHEQTVQPYLILVGKDIQNITSAYVCIDRVMYAFTSVLNAFDVCFKSFHTFNAAYPVESRHLWTLIQKCYYKFYTRMDQIFAHTEHIIAALNKYSGPSSSQSTQNDLSSANKSNGKSDDKSDDQSDNSE